MAFAFAPGISFALALATAVLYILLFPPFGATWLAPIALTPIFIACARESSWKRRLLFGWAAGFLLWCGMCPWIQFVLEMHAGMTRLESWGGFILFGLYKGLPMAGFAVLAGFLMNRWWTIPAGAALWTGIERLHGPMGFAWLDLGNAGIDMPLPMRLAPVTSVYGITFAFAMLGAAVAVVILRRPRRELLWLTALLVLLLVPRSPRSEPGSDQAVVVQPNFDTELEWTRDILDLNEQKLALLSRIPPGSGKDPSLIVWPEVPAPFYFNNIDFRSFVQHVAVDTQKNFLLGGVQFTPQKQPLNSAALLNRSGKLVDRYDKINLVPFGEFIPPLFEWVNKISSEAGDFIPGNRVVVFPLDGHRLSAFICYESVFPDLVRQFSLSGAEVLMNLSNDGYFGKSAAHDQHLQVVRMRAAENRRWIIRATNDGITASIDPRGRIVHRLPPFQQTSGLLPYSYSSELTPYVRYGDWFVWTCLLVSLVACVVGWKTARAAS
jgi:apolipoprotein N-acyltransferase